jgi:nitrite reductase/ring-hydroxylating ferredoxin subunit
MRQSEMNQGPAGSRIGVQSATRSSFPHVPWSWHYACTVSEVRRRPVSCSIGPRELVFAGCGDRISAFERRCVHMGADLSKGRACNGRLRCPLHGWEFDHTGQCVHIPAGDTIPRFARQPTFPTAQIGPHVLVFNRETALFDRPFFDGVAPGELLPAAPFDFVAEMPWYMVAANGFDLQHFRIAHDRRLVDEPQVSCPSPYAYQIRATFEVSGNSLRDRLTRRIAGPRVTMTVVSWLGTLVFVTAEFPSTTSYGMVCVRPIAPNQSHVRNIVWVRRRSGSMKVLDPLDAAVRRWCIRDFLQSDRERSDGIRYNPGSFIEADAVLAGYFNWLGVTAGGETINGWHRL